MIRSMGLSANVRVLGFAPIEDFVGYLGACDIVLNLRYPTVGESSGTLLRVAGPGQGGDGLRGRLLSGIPRRCLPQSAGGRGRRRPDLRVPEPAGVASGGGAALGERAEALRRARVQLGLRSARAVRGVSGSGGGGQRDGARPRRCRAIAETAPSSRAQPAVAWSTCAAGRPSDERARTIWTRTRRAWSRRSRSRRRAAPPTASSRWARTCRSRPRSAPGWATAKCAAATTASSDAPIIASVTSAEGERFDLRRSTTSTPRRTLSRIPTSTSPPCSAAN